MKYDVELAIATPFGSGDSGTWLTDYVSVEIPDDIPTTHEAIEAIIFEAAKDQYIAEHKDEEIANIWLYHYGPTDED